MVTCCPLQGSDEGGPKVHEQSHPIARKEHQCCECGETIAKGVKHELVKGLWDGGWDTYRTCLMCEEIRDHFACDGWIYGQVWNDIEENFFPDMKCGGPCMEGLSPDAKAHLIAKRLEWLFDCEEEPNDDRWDGWSENRNRQRPVVTTPIMRQVAEIEEERKRWFDHRDAAIRRHLEWDPELEFYGSIDF